MRVFIDTNILIDFVADREGFSADADSIFALGVMGSIELLTSALSYVTSMYVAHKYGYHNVKESLLSVSRFVEVLDLQASTVVEMLSSDWKDYEDATQYTTAVQANADCIVTRNKKDFSASSLPAYTPAELLQLLNSDSPSMT